MQRSHERDGHVFPFVPHKSPWACWMCFGTGLLREQHEAEAKKEGPLNLEARWKALLHRADQPSLGPCFFCRYDDQASRQLLDKANLHQLVWSLAVLPVSLPTKYFGSAGIMCNAPWQRSRRCHWGALHTYPGFLASLLHLPCSSTNSFVFYRACWRSLPIRTMEIALAPVNGKWDCEKLQARSLTSENFGGNSTGHGQTVLWHAATKCEAHCMARHEPLVVHKKLESKLKPVTVSGVNWSTGAYQDFANMFFFIYFPFLSRTIRFFFRSIWHTFSYLCRCIL